MIQIAIPRALALSSGQLTLIALTSLASLFVTGSVAVLNLSLNLQSVPLSIIAVSYSVAAFPTLSQFIARKQHAEFLEHMSTAVRHIIFWSMPAMVLFVVLRAQVVRVILGSGAFTWEDTRLTAAALALFVVSVLAQGLNILFIRAYYAAGKTMVPFIVSAAGSLVTIFLASWLTMLFKAHPSFQLFFEHILRVEGLPGTDVLMLPLAFTLGTFVALALFLYTYHRDFGPLANGLVRVLTQTFSASVIGGYAAYHALAASKSVFDFDTDTFFGIFGQGLSGGIVGLVMTILLLLLMRSNEMRDIVDSLSKRLRASTVPPGQEL
jgi:putative peptidoglycan lipid II flippase